MAQITKPGVAKIDVNLARGFASSPNQNCPDSLKKLGEYEAGPTGPATPYGFGPKVQLAATAHFKFARPQFAGFA